MPDIAELANNRNEYQNTYDYGKEFVDRYDLFGEMRLKYQEEGGAKPKFSEEEKQRMKMAIKNKYNLNKTPFTEDLSENDMEDTNYTPIMAVRYI